MTWQEAQLLRRAEGDALKIAGGIFDPENRIPAGRERRGRER